MGRLPARPRFRRLRVRPQHPDSDPAEQEAFRRASPSGKAVVPLAARGRPGTPQTEGMAARPNGRIGCEVLTTTVGPHRDLDRLFKGHNQACDARPQRVPKGGSPDEVVRGRLAEKPRLANPRHKPPDPGAMAEAMRAGEGASGVSRPGG